MFDAGWCAVVSGAVDGTAGAGVVVSGCCVGRTSSFDVGVGVGTCLALGRIYCCDDLNADCGPMK